MDASFQLRLILISVIFSVSQMEALSYDTCCSKKQQTTWCNGSLFMTCRENTKIHILDISVYSCIGNDKCACGGDNVTQAGKCSQLNDSVVLESNISSCNLTKECNITDTPCTNNGVDIRVVINYECLAIPSMLTLSQTRLEEMTATLSKGNSTRKDILSTSIDLSTFISTTALTMVSLQSTVEASSKITSPTISNTATGEQYSSLTVWHTMSYSFTDILETLSPSATSLTTLSKKATDSISTSIPTEVSNYQETSFYSTRIFPTSLAEASSLHGDSFVTSMTSVLVNSTLVNQFAEVSGSGSLEVTLGVTIPVTVVLITVIAIVIFLRLRKRAIRKKQYKTMLHHALFNIDYNAHTEELAIENPMASEVNGLSNYSEIQNINPTGAMTDDTVETGDYNTINLKTFAVRSDPTYGHLVHPDDEIDTTYDCVSRKQTPVHKDDTYAHIGKSYNQANRRKFEHEESTYNTLDGIVDESNDLSENAADTGDTVYDHANNVAPENNVSVKPGVTLQYDDVEINFTNDDFNAYKLESQRDEDINLKRDVDNNPEVAEEEKSGADTDEEKHTYFIL